MEPLISARDLKKNFGKVEALKGVSLDVAEGEKVVVIGPSGSGKSVLIRSINGLERPDSGLLTRWPDTPYRDWFLGDWLAPHGVDTGSEASVSLVNNCFVSDCYARMAQMARLTGHDDEAAAFEARREALNRTIHALF